MLKNSIIVAMLLWLTVSSIALPLSKASEQPLRQEPIEMAQAEDHLRVYQRDRVAVEKPQTEIATRDQADRKGSIEHITHS